MTRSIRPVFSVDPSASQAGFSLVELLVALVAGLILVGGVAEIASYSRQAYRTQDSQSRLQENARFALDILGRDLRNAGHAGCRLLTQRARMSTVANTPIIPLTADSVLRGFQATGASTWSPALPSVLTNLNNNYPGLTVRAGSDVVTVQFGENCRGQLAGDMADKSASIVIPANNTCDLAAGDVALVAECSRTDVFRVSAVTTDPLAGTTTLAHSLSYNTNANLSKPYVRLTAELLRFRSHTYFIGTMNSEPALWRLDNTKPVSNDPALENPVRLVDGVESLKMAFGVDGDGDRAPNQYVAASAVTNWANAQAVRMSVLFRTEEDQVVTGQQTYSFNGSALTAPDQRLRREVVATVGLRNRLQ